jgi:hypothetical protein
MENLINNKLYIYLVIKQWEAASQNVQLHHEHGKIRHYRHFFKHNAKAQYSCLVRNMAMNGINKFSLMMHSLYFIFIDNFQFSRHI